jgi:deazaflavin-dependent oxidoreductase (nitroreductase family)
LNNAFALGEEKVSFDSMFMTGLMIFGMALFMVVAHLVRTHLQNAHGGGSARASHGVFPAVNWLITNLLKLGMRLTILGPMMLLTVPGRITGKPRSVPVDVYEHDGRRFLIATHGQGNWVRNLRAAGEGTLRLGQICQACCAVEMAPEDAGLLIKDVLGPLLASRGIRGSALRQQLGVTADSSPADFVAAARSHPVFELGAPKSMAR